MTYARVLAEQQVWAAVTTHAKYLAFNCTNGVFTWKSIWKELCDILDIEFIPFDESEYFNFVEIMEERGKVWDEIVKKHGLYKTKLRKLHVQLLLKSVIHFGF